MTGMTAPVVTASAALRPERAQSGGRRMSQAAKTPRPCEVCGDPLEGRRPQTRTCSGKCRERTERYRRRRRRPPKPDPNACCPRPCPTETPGSGPWYCANCSASLPTPDWVPE